MSDIFSLPNELLFQVLPFSSLRDQVNFSLTCNSMYFVVENYLDSWFKLKLTEDFPLSLPVTSSYKQKYKYLLSLKNKLLNKVPRISTKWKDEHEDKMRFIRSDGPGSRFFILKRIAHWNQSPIITGYRGGFAFLTSNIIDVVGIWATREGTQVQLTRIENYPNKDENLCRLVYYEETEENRIYTSLSGFESCSEERGYGSSLYFPDGAKVQFEQSELDELVKEGFLRWTP
jgi:hypothetical protein